MRLHRYREKTFEAIAMASGRYYGIAKASIEKDSLEMKGGVNKK